MPVIAGAIRYAAAASLWVLATSVMVLLLGVVLARPDSVRLGRRGMLVAGPVFLAAWLIWRVLR